MTRASRMIAAVVPVVSVVALVLVAPGSPALAAGWWVDVHNGCSQPVTVRYQHAYSSGSATLTVKARSTSGITATGTETGVRLSYSFPGTRATSRFVATPNPRLVLCGGTIPP